MQGLVIVDKPIGLTSAACVGRIKRLLPPRRPGGPRIKIGHAGTLDPLATGVLLVIVGAATKQSARLMADAKGYRAGVRFGATTDTDDAEGEPRPVAGVRPVSPEQVSAAAASFVGDITQTPPIYSALKVGGRRAYDLARRGQEVTIQPRPARVDRLEVVSYDWPDAVLDMTVGKGFYVRSLARDLGELLGVGGYLTSLRRTSVGSYRVEDAVTPDRLEADGIVAHLRSI
jgi:tRNA pseudouridine55 synthase